ncbi:M20 family metallopeptidase [Candidatus Bipolaricaulota bacterium]|nr:M20 family metallopeptidase [Candidatus Bipolaricaulota bacterium]
MSSGQEELKGDVVSNVDGLEGRLREIGHRIFENPELKFEEFKAMKWLTEELEKRGFDVERGVGGLETAFVGRCPHGGDGPTIAYLSEYDALPGLGHACGHNLIATIGLGAGLALCPLMEELDGNLLVIGTPAEEGGGGKIELIESGVFDEVDVAMMVHPSDQTLIGRGSLGIKEIKMDFYGKASHASAEPEKGINALDAAISTFNNINALREHMEESARVHGVITDGGEKPNIVPEHAGALFYVRSPKNDYLEELIGKVKKCAEAGAMAAGADVEISQEGHAYRPMDPNPVLVDLFRDNIESIGVEVGEAKGGMGSTDMGDVSQEMPAIHGYIKIVEEGVPAHSQEFARAADSDEGYEGMIAAAKALAMTGVDVLGDGETFEKVRERFRE